MEETTQLKKLLSDNTVTYHVGKSSYIKKSNPFEKYVKDKDAEIERKKFWEKVYEKNPELRESNGVRGCTGVTGPGQCGPPQQDTDYRKYDNLDFTVTCNYDQYNLWSSILNNNKIEFEMIIRPIENCITFTSKSLTSIGRNIIIEQLKLQGMNCTEENIIKKLELYLTKDPEEFVQKVMLLTRYVDDYDNYDDDECGIKVIKVRDLIKTDSSYTSVYSKYNIEFTFSTTSKFALTTLTQALNITPKGTKICTDMLVKYFEYKLNDEVDKFTNIMDKEEIMKQVEDHVEKFRESLN